MHNFSGKVSFAVGTGRCGTRFLARILDLEPGVSSVHERNPLNEAFHRYCKWYGLPVDHEGYLKKKETEIHQDLKEHQFSFESSAHLSLSIAELHNRFHAKFILLVRRPDLVVNSYFRKGWYQEPVHRLNPELALGYQDLDRFHHFLGRIVPSGSEFHRWQKMTRIGKLAWYWNALNTSVIRQFSKIPDDHWIIVKLEELTYTRYFEIAEFLGFIPEVNQVDFRNIVERRPNALQDVPTISTWSQREVMEFENEVEELAEKLGYGYRINQLEVPEPAVKLNITPGRKMLSKILGLVGGLSARIQKWSAEMGEKIS